MTTPGYNQQVLLRRSVRLLANDAKRDEENEFDERPATQVIRQTASRCSVDHPLQGRPDGSNCSPQGFIQRPASVDLD